jgi:hypothetical protein
MFLPQSRSKITSSPMENLRNDMINIVYFFMLSFNYVNTTRLLLQIYLFKDSL